MMYNIIFCPIPVNKFLYKSDIIAAEMWEIIPTNIECILLL